MKALFTLSTALIVLASLASAAPRDPMACARALGSLRIKEASPRPVGEAYENFYNVYHSANGRDARARRASIDHLKNEIREKQNEFGHFRYWGEMLARVATLGTVNGSPTFQCIQDLAHKRRAQKKSLQAAEMRLRKPLSEATKWVKNALFSEAEGVIRRAVVFPAPAWVHHLSAGDVFIDENSKPDAINAVVRVIGKGGPRGRVDRNKRVEFDVVLHVTYAAVYGTVLFEPEKQKEDVYYYDAFRPGTIRDPQTGQVMAHTSMDYLVAKFEISGVPEKTRHTLLERTHTNSYLFRQADQVMDVATRLKQSTPSTFTDGTKALLRSYIEYWAYGRDLNNRNMLSSSFLIAALKAPEADQFEFARAISSEVRSSRLFRRPMAPLEVRKTFENQKLPKQTRPEQEVPSNYAAGWWMYDYLWSNDRDPCLIEGSHPLVQEVAREAGLKKFPTTDDHQNEATAENDIDPK